MIEYRKANVDDIEAISRIRVEFLSEVNYIDDEIERDKLFENIKRYMMKMIPNKEFVSWLAIDNNKIIGISGVSFYEYPPNQKCLNGKVAYISNMYTYPEHRKRGIASKLFELTVEEAKERGCNKISLNTTDMGRGLYEKFGFTDTKNDMVFYVK